VQSADGAYGAPPHSVSNPNGQFQVTNAGIRRVLRGDIGRVLALGISHVAPDPLSGIKGSANAAA